MSLTINIQKIPKGIYSQITERVRLGLFKNETEVIEEALKKTFAEESRDFLRTMIKNAGISKRSMLQEWKKLRK